MSPAVMSPDVSSLWMLCLRTFCLGTQYNTVVVAECDMAEKWSMWFTWQAMVANKLKMVLASLQRNKTTGRGYSGINQKITVEKN